MNDVNEIPENKHYKGYKEYGNEGKFFTLETPDEVCDALMRAWREHKRVRIFYGNPKTGRESVQEYDTIGYVSFSMGPLKIPILCKQSRSSGGMAIADSIIVKLRYSDGTVLYQHKDFYRPVITSMGRQVFLDGGVYACCETEKQAQRLADFLNDKRLSK